MSENPYNPLRPTSDPTLFFGRSEALAFLQLNLSGRVTNRALVILGQPGIGKSSLLNQVPLVVDERYPGVKVDLSGLELDSPVTLISTLVDKTHAMMTSIQASTYRLPPFPDPTDPRVDLLEWFADDYLAIVMSAIRRERHMIFMLDNAHLLFKAVGTGHFPSDFMVYLQRLLDTYEQLDILATLDIAYEQIALQNPPFDDPNVHHRLTHLLPSDAQRLITEPVADLYRFSTEAIDYILQAAGGHPFYIHAICHLIHRRWDESRHMATISLEDVEGVYATVLEMETPSIAWEQWRPNERLALTALLDIRKQQQKPVSPQAIGEWLAATDYPLDDVQLAAAFRGLEYWGILQRDDDGRYDFAVAMEADLLAQELNTELPPASPRMSPWSLAAIVAIIMLVLGGALIMGSLGDGDENSEAAGSRATVTLELDIAATRESVVQTQTAVAQPTATPTLRPIFQFGG